MKTLQINGLDWKIEEVDGFYEANTMGRTMYTPDLRIYVLKALKGENKKMTLRHELVHAILFSYGFSNITTFSVEALCDFMSAHSRFIENYINDYFKEYER